jgi:hypothetical protein
MKCGCTPTKQAPALPVCRALQAQCPKCICEKRQKLFITKSIESHKNVDTFLYDKVDFCDGEINKTTNGNGNVRIPYG